MKRKAVIPLRLHRNDLIESHFRDLQKLLLQRPSFDPDPIKLIGRRNPDGLDFTLIFTPDAMEIKPSLISEIAAADAVGSGALPRFPQAEESNTPIAIPQMMIHPLFIVTPLVHARWNQYFPFNDTNNMSNPCPNQRQSTKERKKATLSANPRR